MRALSTPFLNGQIVVVVEVVHNLVISLEARCHWYSVCHSLEVKLCQVLVAASARFQCKYP